MTTPNGTSYQALVTGASRGLGLEFVRRCLLAGRRVIAAARVPESSRGLAELRAEHGDRLEVETLDVGSESSIASLRDRLAGGQVRLGLVINNAGVSRDEAFGDWTAENFAKHFRVNAIGPALVSQAVAPLLVDGAKVVNVTSGMGSLAWNQQPEGPLDAYAASKAALNLLTRRLAAKLALRGVTVAAISPGWVRTDMGGPEAPEAADEAVATIAATIERLTPADSGRFLDSDGSPIPW